MILRDVDISQISLPLFFLRRFANGVRGYYGVPVYLVGSALRANDPMKCRDVDVRIELSHDEFMRFYAPNRHDSEKVVMQWIEEDANGNWSDLRWRWADDCIKRSRAGWRQTHMHIDFQVYPTAWWNYFSHRPRYRLDTRED